MTTEPDERGLAVVFIYAFCILLCALVGGAAPLAMGSLRSHRVDKAIVLGTVFGSGIFLAAGFIHLLGDASKALNTDSEDGYPLAELWCAVGVLIPLCIDSAASIFSARAAAVRSGGGGSSSSSRQSTTIEVPPPMCTRAQPDGSSAIGHPADETLVGCTTMSCAHAHAIKSLVLIDASPEGTADVVLEDLASSDAAATASSAGPGQAERPARPPPPPTARSQTGRRRGRTTVAVNVVGAAVLLLALTLHSFVAGLVLGMGGRLETGLFLAIILHKAFAAFALGCALARTERAQLSLRAAWLSLAGFACTTPLGIFVGVGLAEASWVDGRAQATLVALAAGFFLYVGLMEVVAKELVVYQTKGAGIFAFLKLLMLVLGFALMAVLGLWV